MYFVEIPRVYLKNSLKNKSKNINFLQYNLKKYSSLPSIQILNDLNQNKLNKKLDSKSNNKTIKSNRSKKLEKSNKLKEEVSKFALTELIQLISKESDNYNELVRDKSTADADLWKELKENELKKKFQTSSGDDISSAKFKPIISYLMKKHIQRMSGKFGSKQIEIMNPKNDIMSPRSIEDVSISHLLAAGCHLGHSTSIVNSKSQPFLYGHRNGIHIINLEKTIAYLRRACSVLQDISYRGGVILFVGTKDGIEKCITMASERSGGYHVFKKWIPGAITNSLELSKNWSLELRKNNDQRVGEKNKQHNEACIPDIVVFLNPLENKFAINECSKFRIPTIGIVDTNADPELVTYPIPSNDDNIRSIEVITGILSKSAEKGRIQRIKEYSMDNDNLLIDE